MKKVIRFVLISITFAIIFNSLAIADTIVNIPVPYTDTTVQARIIGSELVGLEISYLNNQYVVFGGTLLSNPTKRYNSHSYAWYSQNVETNQYWIDDPTNYYSSIKYEEVTTPQVGDIICYYDGQYYLVKATSEAAALQVVNGLQHEVS